MKLAWQSAFSALSLTVLCATAQSAPPRILVQPPRAGVGDMIARDRGACASQTLALYVHEWIGNPGNGLHSASSIFSGSRLSPARKD